MTQHFNISLGLSPGLITVNDDRSVSLAYGNESWLFGQDWTPLMYSKGERMMAFAADVMAITKIPYTDGQPGEPMPVDFADGDLHSFIQAREIILGRLGHSPAFPREFYTVTPSVAFGTFYSPPASSLPPRS